MIEMEESVAVALSNTAIKGAIENARQKMIEIANSYYHVCMIQSVRYERWTMVELYESRGHDVIRDKPVWEHGERCDVWTDEDGRYHINPEAMADELVMTKPSIEEKSRLYTTLGEWADHELTGDPKFPEYGDDSCYYKWEINHWNTMETLRSCLDEVEDVDGDLLIEVAFAMMNEIDSCWEDVAVPPPASQPA